MTRNFWKTEALMLVSFTFIVSNYVCFSSPEAFDSHLGGKNLRDLPHISYIIGEPEEPAVGVSKRDYEYERPEYYTEINPFECPYGFIDPAVPKTRCRGTLQTLCNAMNHNLCEMTYPMATDPDIDTCVAQVSCMARSGLNARNAGVCWALNNAFVRGKWTQGFERNLNLSTDLTFYTTLWFNVLNGSEYNFQWFGPDYSIKPLIRDELVNCWDDMLNFTIVTKARCAEPCYQL